MKKVFTNNFQFYVYPKHFGFQWTEPVYLDVTYAATIDEGVSKVAVTYTGGAPYYISSIVINGNWMAVCAEMQLAAEDNFAKEQSKWGVHPTVLNSIAHFIRP